MRTAHGIAPLLLVLAGCVGAAGSPRADPPAPAPAAPRPHPEFTEANARRIREGMGHDAVRLLFGRPDARAGGECATPPGGWGGLELVYRMGAWEENRFVFALRGGRVVLDTWVLDVVYPGGD